MMIDYEQLVSEMQARAEEAEAALKLATEERDEQNAAIANLTSEAVIAAEAKLDAVFGSVFQAEDPPMLDYARLKMELRRLRVAHIAARKVIGELTDHLKEYDNEQLSDWWNKSVDGLLSHRLVSAPEKGAQG